MLPISSPSQWGKIIMLIGVIALLVLGIIQTEKKYAEKPCKHIQVQVIPVQDQHFIDADTMLAYLTSRVEGLASNHALLHNIPTKTLENIIKSHNFVLHCCAYKHWKGDIQITIIPRKILARMLHTDSPGCYIDNEGKVVPLSPTYTPRVVLLESAQKYAVNDVISASPAGERLLHLLQALVADQFWKTQITHIAINHQDEVTLTTKLGRHTVLVGSMEQWEEKLKRLKLFYAVILPAKGWEAYKIINLKFDTQIVCE